MSRPWCYKIQNRIDAIPKQETPHRYAQSEQLPVMTQASPCNTAGVPAQSRNAQLLLAGAMLLWGLNIPAIKLLATRFDPVTLAALRMLCACGVFALIALRRKGELPRIARRHWGLLFVCSLLMVYGNQLFFTGGMVLTTATNTALIVALGPLMSSLLAALVFRERPGLAGIAGIGLGLIGVGLVVLHRPGAGLGRASVGDAMIGASVFSFAIGGVLVQRLARQLDAVAISWGIYTTGTVLLFLHACLAGFDTRIFMAGAGTWSLLLFSGIAATAIGNLIWNRSIGVLGISRTALYLNWVPLFAIAFAVLFLDEPMSWWLVLGFACVVSGTRLGTMRRRQAA
jgi:drug/metabolite transporter (DMT)-like permease